MVMHARKQSKLSDGYTDRKDTHLQQDMQYHSSIFTSDSDDDGPTLGSQVSPRYQNKPTFIERNTEMRGSLSLAEKKVSHYLATGSLGRPVPLDNNFIFSGEHFSASGIPDPQNTASSSDQNKERLGIHSERGVGDSNSHLGCKPEGKISTHISSYHHHPTKQTNRNLSHLQPAGGDNNSHSEKDNTLFSYFLANNGKQVASTAKDKEQVQKSAIRVCGDWSEHISSSGKRYYYNCKTEVSQWEKPKEWNSEMCRTPDHRSKDGRPRMLSQGHANRISADSRASRHSSSSDHHQQEPARSHRTDNGDLVPESHHGKEPSFSFTHHHYRDSRESRNSQQLSMEYSQDSNTRESGDMQKSGVESTQSTDSTTTNSHPHYHHHQVTPHHSGSTPRNNGFSDLKHIDNKRFQHDGQYASPVDYKRLSNEVLRRRRTDSQGSQRYDIGQGPVDDMEISPSPPSSSSLPSSATSTPQLPPTSTPIAACTTPASNSISTVGGSHHSSSLLLGNPIPTLVNRQPVIEGGNYDKTIQTLQELQKVLSMHIKAHQNTANTRPIATHSQGRHSAVPLSCQQGTPSQHLIYPVSHGNVVSGSPAVVQHQPYTGGHVQGQTSMGLVPITQGEEELVGRTSPVSATSSRSSCGSPTPSDSSSQNAAVTSQALSAAAIKREETAKLTASLSNYYNEKLIGHVLGWQADIVEKQAAKLWEESMVIGSEQCNKISVQLKRARSHVRIAEIQATLHEQRIMSSDQQYQEIENLKISYSFLPS